MKLLGKNYKNGWQKFKKNYSNLYIILISIAIVTWFYAVTGIIKLITNGTKTIEVYIILIFISLAIMYMDDSNLSELYNLDNGVEAAAGVAAVGGST